MSIQAIVFDFDHTLYDRNVTLANLAWPFRRAFAVRPQVRAAELLCALLEADEQSIIDETNWPGMLGLLCARNIFDQPPAYDAFYAFFLERFPAAIRLHPETLDTLHWCEAEGNKTDRKSTRLNSSH